MIRASLFAASVAAMVAVPSGARAQAAPDPSDAGCQAAVEARNKAIDARKQLPTGAAATGHYCAVLAEAVLSNLREAARLKTTVGFNVNQPTITDTPGGESSAGQTAAVASGQPVASAGGNIAAVGETGRGLQLVTALAINPASIATGDTSSDTVWTSRLGDLSLVLPVTVDPAQRTKNGFQYVGARFRFNAIPALHSQTLVDTVAKFKTLATTLSTFLPQVTQLVTQASDPGKCADALEAQDKNAEQAQCGSTIDLTPLADPVAAAWRSLRAFRELADRAYLTLEGRYDRGELVSEDAAHKDSLFAAYLAAGYRLNPTSDGTTAALRVRGGVVYFQNGAMQESRYAFYGAVGVELAAVRDLRRYTLSVGAELVKRSGNADLGMEPLVHNAIRIGVSVPLADGKTVSVGLSIPVNGGEPTLALSGDWSALLDH